MFRTQGAAFGLFTQGVRHGPEGGHSPVRSADNVTGAHKRKGHAVCTAVLGTPER